MILDKRENLERGKKEFNRIIRIPYIGTVYHRLARLMHQYDIQPVPFPFRTIRQLVSKPKDFLDPKLRQNVCYQIDCSCGHIYVGETGRVAQIRWTEHKKDLETSIKKRAESIERGIDWTEEKTDALKSSFKYHLDHKPDFTHGTILSSHISESDRINSEAIFIRKARLQEIGTILNSNSGRQLDPIFDSIIGLTGPIRRPPIEDPNITTEEHEEI